MCGISNKWFIAAGVLLALGIGLFILALACIGWDITKLSTVKL